MAIYALIIFLYLLTIYSVDKKRKTVKQLLFLGLTLMAITVAMRSNTVSDTRIYTLDFWHNTKSIWEWSVDAKPYGYFEKGFHVLGFIVKTFTTNEHVYFFFVVALTYLCLYKALIRYCSYPLIGMFVYACLFMLNRDFIQIRSSLAIMIIFSGIRYFHQRKAIKFFLVVFVAYQFHHMSILAIPFYIFNAYRFSKGQIILGIATAFVLAIAAKGLIAHYVDVNASDVGYGTYTTGGYRESELGILNPVIYMQLFILALYTYNEDKLKNLNAYYYTYRNGYFFSTLILITFSQYTALSGRTSTMFATFSLFIVSSFFDIFHKKNKALFFLFWGGILIGFFYLKLGVGGAGLFSDGMSYSTTYLE